MFSFDELSIIHIEISNRCQASCPMCPRNIHGGITNPLLPINDWNIDDFVKIFSKEILEQVNTVNFCGNFGDPLMNNDLIKMCEYLKTNAPNIEVLIHTNGSMRSANWWKTLYQSLPNKHNVIFALDGLEDTHHLYRMNTDYNLIIKNAKTFIAEGGNAEWCFIRFKHNEHQVNDVEKLSKELGFKKFTLKNSRRIGKGQLFPVVDSSGKVLYNIETPTDSVIKFVGKKELLGHQQWEDADNINCLAITHKELYIDAHYQLSPCCMIGAFLYTNYDIDFLKKFNLYQEDSVIEEGIKIKNQVLEFPRLNVLDTGLKNIINTDQWQTMWQKKWKDRSSSTCIIMCGSSSPYLGVDEQRIKIKTNV